MAAELIHSLVSPHIFTLLAPDAIDLVLSHQELQTNNPLTLQPGGSQSKGDGELHWDLAASGCRGSVRHPELKMRL